jgi:hypothetical protein
MMTGVRLIISYITGVPQHAIVKMSVRLTKSTVCVLSGSEQCCYRTFDVLNNYMAVS